jgi:hypothetical protein
MKVFVVRVQGQMQTARLSLLSKWHHTKELSSVPQKVCAFQYIGSATCGQRRYNNKSSQHVESTHAPSPGFSSRSAGSTGGCHLEDHFLFLQDKLHKTDLYDMLQLYLALLTYGILPSAGFETFLQLILGIPNIPKMASQLQIIM